MPAPLLASLLVSPAECQELNVFSGDAAEIHHFYIFYIAEN